MAGAAAAALGTAFVLERNLIGEDEPANYLTGFNDDFVAYSHSNLGPEALRKVRACGGRCARIGIDWGVVQAEDPGSFDWTAYDPIFLQALVAGVQLLPTIFGCPEWAGPTVTAPRDPNSDPEFPDDHFRTCSPEHDPDFGNFADATLKHFDAPGMDGGMRLVSAVEILNEPNIWTFGAVPAARVRQLATAAAGKVAESQRRGDFSAPMKVISGGPAPVSAIGPDNVKNFPARPSWQQYLEELLEGGKPDFDIGFHSYETYKPPPGTLTAPEGDSADPYARAGQFAEWQASRILEQLDEALNMSPVDVWMTETGASSAGIWSEDIFTSNYRREHGEEIQADVLTRVARGVGERHRCRSMIVHRLFSNDEAEPPPTASEDSVHYQDGVYESADGKAKLAVAALEAAWP